MTYLVTDKCIKCKYTECVEVCPTEAFCEGPNFVVIDPDDCIHCGLCVQKCPTKAIYSDTDKSVDVDFWVAIGRTASKHWPRITRKKEPLSDANKWKNVKNKLSQLEQWDGKKPFNDIDNNTKTL